MELIGIREASRRLGVSDTAVHKAIKAGRVTLAEPTPTGRPRVAWPLVQEQWERNTNPTHRTHAGPRTEKARKAAKAPPPAVIYREPEPAPEPPPARPEPPRAAPDPEPEPASAPAAAPAPAAPPGPSLAQYRAIREAYQARLAKLEYEQRIGQLVPADEVKVRWFKLITAAKTRILGIPAACKTRVSDLPLSVIAAIDEVCREALEDLANERD